MLARILHRPFTEPTGNVKPRIAGERYEGGKLIDVLKTNTAALDCATQGFPVPLTRYIGKDRRKPSMFFLRFYIIRFQRVQVRLHRDHRGRNMRDGKLF